MTRVLAPGTNLVTSADTSRLGLVDRTARAAAGIGAAVSADVHFDLWYSDGFRDIPTIGPLFLLNAVGGLVVAFAVICWRHWLSALAAVGFGAATLGAFWWSVTWGLFGVQESATGQTEVQAELAEILAIVGGVVALACAWSVRRHGAKGVSTALRDA